MKAVLSILLTLVLTAGPWLCCCTAGHIARTEPHSTSTPHKASCCSTPKPTQSPDDAPLAPTRSCSCQAEIQPAALTASDSLLPDMPLLSLAMDCSSDWSEQAIPALPADESLPCPFLEARDILRAFHILRC
jgi:hypothetical protein